MHVREQRRRSNPALDARAVPGRMPRWEAGVFWALTTVVLLSPLPFGGDRPLPASLLCTAIGALVLVSALAGWLADRDGDLALRPLLPAAMLFAATVAWAALQGASFTPGSLHHPDLGPGARGAGGAGGRRDQRQPRGDLEPPSGPARLRRGVLARLPALPDPGARPAGDAGADARRAGLRELWPVRVFWPARARDQHVCRTAIPTRPTRASRCSAALAS